MPIVVKDIQWSQSERHIIVRIPLNGVNHSTVNVFTSKTFIKLNYPPYYYEAFLLHEIDVDQSKCKLYETEARFTLQKHVPIEWKALQSDEVNRQNVSETKVAILSDVQMEQQRAARLRIEAKASLKRDYVQLEIDRERKIQDAITATRNMDCSQALRKVEESDGRQESVSWMKNPSKMFHLNADECAAQKPVRKLTGTTVSSAVVASAAPTPDVRPTKTITISMSARKFTTPKRESQQAVEDEWLLKLYEAKKGNGFVDDDLRPEERDPQWLKEKGNDLFRKSNYLGAISAYSTGIRLADKCYDLYLNRSAAHLAIGNYKRCVRGRKRQRCFMFLICRFFLLFALD